MINKIPESSLPRIIIDRISTKISRKIAIIGIARSGKTVFMTSLINHLKEHNKMDFLIESQNGKFAQITHFKDKSIPKNIGKKFNYEAYRDALVYNGKWPSKTTDTSHFICDFKRSDWKFNHNQLHFFDMPGERFADVAIAKYKNFGDWSDYMIKYFKSDSTYRQLSENYLKMQEDGGKTKPIINKVLKGSTYTLDEKEVLRLYRQTLAQFVLEYKPMVSPSTFLLDQNGGTPQSETKEDFLEEAKGRVLGLLPKNGTHREFAPLSKHIRQKNIQLTKLFTKNYKAYRNQVVLPLFQDLKSSKRLIILIDIPSLLNGGVAMYNDNREILENIFDTLSPEALWWRIFTTVVKVDRVALVATKSDSVHPTDVNDGKLMRLLKDMTRKFYDNLDDDVYKEWFVCSAVISAKGADEGEYMMRGILEDSNKQKKEHIFKVSKLPNGWPKNWNPGDFSFPSVLPRVPANKGIPPDHENLDKIFTFITED